MTMSILLAEIATKGYLPSLNVLLPLGAGIVAGLGVVGVIHFLGRQRRRVAPAGVVQAADTDLDPFVEGSAKEHRKAFRRHGNPVEVQLVNQETKAPPF